MSSTYPAPGLARPVEKNEDKSSPKRTKHGNQPNNKTHDEGWRDQVTQCLHPQKTRECISLHGLEHVVLGHVKDFRVITAHLLNGNGDVLGNGTRKRDLSLRTRQQESVEYLLG